MLEFKPERSYQFRQRLLTVHEKNRRDRNKLPEENQILIDNRWEILLPVNAERAVVAAAKDMQDYLFTSMSVSLKLTEYNKLCKTLTQKLIFIIGNEELDTSGSYKIDANKNVIIYGFDSWGAAQGWYHLEDLMNIASIPIVARDSYIKRPVFSPRMTHSGYGINAYPDQYLSKLAHLGIDAIIIHVTGLNTTPSGFLDFNELIYRAKGYGIDVYASIMIKSELHPDDPLAVEYYEERYGRLFEQCPELKGIFMVGECIEFPSKDHHTTGRLRLDKNPDGLPNSKPSPGWWPCEDLPNFLNLIKKIIRRYNSNAEILLATYNWGYVDKEHRIKLLRNLPKDIALVVYIDMFEKIRTDNLTTTVVDHSLFFAGYGEYFKSEAEEAKRLGIKLFSCIASGQTWDIGVIPYQPAPYLWEKRYNKFLEANKKWNLTGIRENIHWGLWPSFINELEKNMFWFPAQPFDYVLKQIVVRDYTETYADLVMDAMRLLSDGFSYYLPTNEDQYGPFRIGPSFPLLLNKKISIPDEEYAMFGNRIVYTDYYPRDTGLASLGNFRFPYEIQELIKMRNLIKQAADILDDITCKLNGWRRNNAFYFANMTKFIVNCCTTTINTKRWYLLYTKLSAAEDEQSIRDIIAKMKVIGTEEIQNAFETIPLVEADSRLGWEPSMEYMTDKKHLEWKIKVTEITVNDLDKYINSLKYNYFNSK